MTVTDPRHRYALKIELRAYLSHLRSDPHSPLRLEVLSSRCETAPYKEENSDHYDQYVSASTHNPVALIDEVNQRYRCLGRTYVAPYILPLCVATDVGITAVVLHAEIARTERELQTPARPDREVVPVGESATIELTMIADGAELINERNTSNVKLTVNAVESNETPLKGLAEPVLELRHHTPVNDLGVVGVTFIIGPLREEEGVVGAVETHAPVICHPEVNPEIGGGSGQIEKVALDTNGLSHDPPAAKEEHESDGKE